MAPSTASPKASTSASSSKKRSAPPADDRFAAFDSLSADEAEAEEAEESATGSTSPKSFPRQSTLPAHLLPSALTGSKSKKQPGLIYLSRIPPGMGPSKVKHLLSAYGEVGRVYLARAGELRARAKAELGSTREGLGCDGRGAGRFCRRRKRDPEISRS